VRELLAGRLVDFLKPLEPTSDRLDPPQRLEAAEKLIAAQQQQIAERSRETAALRERAAKLELLDGLIQELAGVLDLRTVFDRVSKIAKQVLPNDAIGLPIITEDGEHVIPFATIGLPAGTFPPIQPLTDFHRSLLAQPWEFQIFDDIQAEFDLPPDTPAVRLGYRSVLRVPVRLHGEFSGVLVLMSRTPALYSQADVLLARRIADHIALSLSHQRLAEEARRNEELQARTTNLELLDALLATLIDSGALPDVFSRISEIARKVLAHDAAVLMVRLPDGRHARLYASTGPPVRLPETTEVPPELLQKPDWEYDIFDDLSLCPPYYAPLLHMGLRSLLRVPIRLDGRFSGALIFFSTALAAFKETDVLVARRMADRLAITLARDREVEASKRADEAATRAARLESRVRALTEELDAQTGYRRVVGESKHWRQVLTQATQVAATETTVLLLGESGTGKEVVARFLHRASPRANGPFIALNCAALPEQLLEAELFGYERGAYTGATQSKPGQLEQAAGGTLFLDEVAEMSPSAQAKFLRVLQEREFQRLGGTRVLRTDARIVAATNRDLARAIAQGQFREDLYYRLNVFAIQLPPLRERREDILPLSEAFLSEIGRGLGQPPAGISRDAREMLTAYHWPGNVRELRNILERAAILCEGGLITAEYLSLKRSTPVVSAPVADTKALRDLSEVVPVAAGARPSSAGDLQILERGMIEQALQSARFNKSKAAKALGLTRQQLYVRMRKYGLE
jgi:transcriptional regulator with GAF, ATPase, and Fis domain